MDPRFSRWTWKLLTSWLLMGALAHPSIKAGQDGSKKVAIPDPAAQKEAEKVIREVFKDDYAKRQPAERALLARKLLGQGVESKDDAVARFVLFREARDLAVQAGDVDLCLKSIDEMGKVYDVDPVSLKSSSLLILAKNAKTPDELVGWAKHHLGLVTQALAADEYDVADKQAELAIGLARRGKDSTLIVRSEILRKAIAEKKAQYGKLKSARATLETNPTDPAASLLIGQYECLVRGNWEKGLPLLTQSSDGLQKDLAQRDLAKPTDPVDQAAVGDGWWDLREKEKGTARENLGSRALYWYERAAPKLTGLNKTKVDQRILPLRLEQLAKGDWVDVTDPALYGQKGKPGDPLEIPSKPGEKGDSFVLSKFPPGEFDGWSARLRPSVQMQAGIVIFEAQSIGAIIDRRNEECSIAKRLPGGDNWDYLARGKLQRLDECVLTVFIEGGEYVGYADGQEFGRVKTTNNRISRLELGSFGGPLKLDQVRLRRRQ